MVGMKEWKKQDGDTTVSVKNRNNDPGFSHNPCGGCNACHTMTSIHPVTDNPIFGGSGDGSGGHWPNLQRPCATNFFQRNLGNNAMQAIAGSRQTSGQATPGGGTAVIQRKCACGGSCASCAGKEEELGKIQTKLTIGPANDVYEQEADRVAGQIMRLPDSFGQYEDNQSNLGINIQRIAAGGDSLHTDSDIQLSLNDGQPLSSSTRQFMEPRFGMDFSHVRLHTGHDAHQTASQIQAKAFTYGHQIWLGKGESEQNKGLMAHELTHVVQQGGAAHNRQVQMARLPCTSRKKVDVYSVNLPGSTRSIYDDLTTANNILCQCGLEINVKGGESWSTNLLDQDPPAGVLNAPAGTVRPLTAEENAMLSHKPGGADVIHVYYVPSFSGPKLAEAFWPSQHGDRAVAVANAAIPVVFPHEIGHVLQDDGSHRDSNPDNLMASGSVNTGVGELEQDQCDRMP